MRSLTWKITLALILTSLLGVGFVALYAGLLTSSGFEELRRAQIRQQFIEAVSEYYSAEGTLVDLQEAFRQPLPSAPGDQASGRGRGAEGQFPLAQGQTPLFFLVDADGIVRTFTPQHEIGERVSQRELERGIPLLVEGERIGTLITLPQRRQRDPLEQEFINTINRGLVLAAAGVVLVASLVGVSLARRLTTPLRELTGALRDMEAGKLEQRVETRGQDEIGELVLSFNRMSAEIARANQLRRQMTADIAHDLRTPLSVITGYLEALADGTLPPSPERFQTLKSEATLLQRLIEDLRTLSLADAGELTLQREDIDMGAFLRDVQRFYAMQAEAAGVAVRTELPRALPAISADRVRLGQVLGNLITNGLRHTPAGGSITLGAAPEDDSLRVWVRDTGEGIAPEKLQHIFERFYRVDEARTQADGQTGLGLAITRALVEAHGGRISAASEPGQGTTMTITLPLVDAQ